MDTAYDERGVPYPLGPKVASGGQGTIWRIAGHETFCVKVYHKPPDPRHIAKLRVMIGKQAALGKVAALPTSLAFSDKAKTKIAGVFLPFIVGKEIFELYGTRSRLQHFATAKYNFLVHTACNLAAAFEDLHAAGIIVGDINEQNLKIRPDATLCLIDSDSFQVSDGVRTYTSDVGTPIWTPPELQGQNLTGLKRTVNHDGFGLAQLIFLLLFLGRNPFAGRPRGQKHLPPEEAVREYAFAFAPNSLLLPLKPPPGCLEMEFLPPAIQRLFQRAFLRGSGEPNHRPTAAEWLAALRDFMGSLAPCAKLPWHMHWRHAPACPWCKIMAETGLDMFPAPGAASHAAGGSALDRDDGYLLKLAALRPHSFEASAPRLQLHGILPDPLPPRPEGVLFNLRKLFTSASARQLWLGPRMAHYKTMLNTAEAVITNALNSQRRAIVHYQTIHSLIIKQFQTFAAETKNPAGLNRSIELKVASELQHDQLQKWLTSHTILKAYIEGIGQTRKGSLIVHGVITAADVNRRAIARVPGIGAKLTNLLLKWRAKLEAEFQFKHPRPNAAQLKLETDKQFTLHLRKLKANAKALEAQLNQAQKECHDQLRQDQAVALQSARQRDIARANLDFLEQALRGGAP